MQIQALHVDSDMSEEICLSTKTHQKRKSGYRDTDSPTECLVNLFIFFEWNHLFCVTHEPTASLLAQDSS